MAEYILKINSRSKNARSLIDYLRNLDYVVLQDKNVKEYTPNEETLEAMREVREGGGLRFKNFEDYKNNILK